MLALERLEATKALEACCSAQIKLLENPPSVPHSPFPWEILFLVLGLVVLGACYFYLIQRAPSPTDLAPVAQGSLSTIQGIENLVALQYTPGQVSRVYQHAERLLQLAYNPTGLSPAQLIEEANTIYGHLGEGYVQVAPLVHSLTSNWSGPPEVLFTTPLNFISNSAGVHQTLSNYVQTVSEATEVYGQISSGAFSAPLP